jgi:hypothetical protein
MEQELLEQAAPRARTPCGNGVCGRTWSTRPKWKRPGYWRPFDIQLELNRRFKLGYDITTHNGMINLRARFKYLRDIGIIPQATHKQGGIANYYTDEEAEEVFAAVRAAIIRT